jgi:hypothetical protein
MMRGKEGTSLVRSASFRTEVKDVLAMFAGGDQVGHHCAPAGRGYAGEEWEPDTTLGAPDRCVVTGRTMDRGVGCDRLRALYL